MTKTVMVATIADGADDIDQVEWLEVDGRRFVLEKTCSMLLKASGVKRWWVCSECGKRTSDIVELDVPPAPEHCRSCGAKAAV